MFLLLYIPAMPSFNSSFTIFLIIFIPFNIKAVEKNISGKVGKDIELKWGSGREHWIVWEEKFMGYNIRGGEEYQFVGDYDTPWNEVYQDTCFTEPISSSSCSSFTDIFELSEIYQF